MKFLKMGLYALLALFSSVLVINAIYWNFMDDELLIYVSPHVGQNMDIVDRDKPTKIYVEKLNSKNELISDKILLTNNPQQIQKLISDLKWTWVTNLKEYPSDEWYYSLSFEDSNGLVYPLVYYPQSDVIEFPGYQNFLSINSSDILKQLLNSLEKNKATVAAVSGIRV